MGDIKSRSFVDVDVSSDEHRIDQDRLNCRQFLASREIHCTAQTKFEKKWEEAMAELIAEDNQQQRSQRQD